MERRPLGDSAVELSPLTLGSMRMEVGGFPDAHWLGLLHFLAEGGVTAFHSSPEYESYPRFCRLVQQLRRERTGLHIQHIVKLAAPNFKEPRFDADRFRLSVEMQLQALATERLDVVQWLIRQTPNTDGPRLAVLREALPQVAEAWQQLRAAGKVGALTSFPYSVDFADEVVRFKFCAGLTSYLNPIELEYADHLDEMQDRGQGFLAIRPMFAGKILDSATTENQSCLRALRSLGADAPDLARFCLSFPLLHPAVASVIVSIGTLQHAQQAIAAVETATADAAEFHRLRRIFAGT